VDGSILFPLLDHLGLHLNRVPNDSPDRWRLHELALPLGLDEVGSLAQKANSLGWSGPGSKNLARTSTSSVGAADRRLSPFLEPRGYARRSQCGPMGSVTADPNKVA
jgi:hypothetical protein